LLVSSCKFEYVCSHVCSHVRLRVLSHGGLMWTVRGGRGEQPQCRPGCAHAACNSIVGKKGKFGRSGVTVRVLDSAMPRSRAWNRNRNKNRNRNSSENGAATVFISVTAQRFPHTRSLSIGRAAPSSTHPVWVASFLAHVESGLILVRQQRCESSTAHKGSCEETSSVSEPATCVIQQGERTSGMREPAACAIQQRERESDPRASEPSNDPAV
jgi:hypothetical protein